MNISIGKFDCTEVWDGTYYINLADYPHVADWEMRNILDFMRYERAHGRDCMVDSDDPEVLHTVLDGLAHPEKLAAAMLPGKLTECTACLQGGCMTDMLCHTASPENAAKIFDCGMLLSAVRARRLPAQVLMAEPRNAAHDPADFFEYVMLAWGNCQAGDRLVMERKLGHAPDERELSAEFTPGVRFYFEYAALARHPDAVHDGFLPLKVRDGISLADYACAIIIPEELRTMLECHVPENLQARVHYVVNDCADIWQWSAKVYDIVRTLERDI